jgi:hypothetical protein
LWTATTRAEKLLAVERTGLTTHRLRLAATAPQLAEQSVEIKRWRLERRRFEQQRGKRCLLALLL